MENCRVLIISNKRIFIEALTRLVQGAGARVIAQANDPAAALPVLQTRQAEIVIVDQSEARFTEKEVMHALLDHQLTFKLIFFNDTNNQMIVYHRRQTTYLAPDQLVEVLQPTG